jgi:hypothetical protein
VLAGNEPYLVASEGSGIDPYALVNAAQGIVPDPWQRRCLIDEYVVADTRPDADDEGSPADVMWCAHFDGPSPAELRKVRTMQMVQMGRYGHQSMVGWDEMELREFLEHYQALVELMREEGALGNALET